MTSGKETASSDVDLLIIGDVGFSEIAKAVYSSQQVLGREINPKVYSKEEWNQMREEKDAFVKEVLGKPKLFISGSLDVVFEDLFRSQAFITFREKCFAMGVKSLSLCSNHP
jgi:hypothetical protein